MVLLERGQLKVKDLNIAVLGLGREGLDLLRFLNNLGIKPTGLDNKTPKELGDNYKEIKKRTTKVYLGKDHFKYLNTFDLVFRSPGVSPNLAAIKQAKQEGTVFSSATQLFFDLCPTKIIGVTGTKGKSTVVSLIHHILKGSIKGNVYLGGNIGFSPLSLLSKLTKKDVVVLELSSFQLEDLNKSPNIAVMLNVTPEHLDRHKDFKKYLVAKSNIFLHQQKNDYLATSADYLVTRNAAKKARSKIIKYSLRKVLSRGVYLADDEIIVRDLKTGKRSVVISRLDIPLLGIHNLENIIVAISVALLLGVSLTDIQKKIKSFKSLSHRLEFVGKIGKVKFINDSMATTPIAVEAAIKSIDGPLSLIVGGVSKGESLDDLAKVLNKKRIKGIVLIGKTANRLASLLDLPKYKARNLKEAVKKAHNYIEDSGGSVLLTPGFASFDMFKDAYDRGDQFKKVVNRLAKK